MLLASFRRKAVRRHLSSLLAAWREYVVHGAVETRSRSQLLAAMRAQAGTQASQLDG